MCYCFDSADSISYSTMASRFHHNASYCHVVSARIIEMTSSTSSIGTQILAVWAGFTVEIKRDS